MTKRPMSLARQLREYIRARARVEGVGFDLSLSLFEEAVARCASPVFGVEHDGQVMIRDLEEPYAGFFLEKSRELGPPAPGTCRFDPREAKVALCLKRRPRRGPR